MLDRFGDGRRALSGIRHHYGASGLDNLAVLDKYLPLMLPRDWELTAVIRSAATQKVARRLADRVARGAAVPDAVGEVADMLTGRSVLDRSASAWVVAEYATVLGYDTSGVPAPAEDPIVLPNPRLAAVSMPVGEPARAVRRPAVALLAAALVVAVAAVHGGSNRGGAARAARLVTAAVCNELSDGLATASGDAVGSGDPADMPGMSGPDMVSMNAYTMIRSLTTSERDLFAAEAARAADPGLAAALSAYAGQLTVIVSGAKSLTDMQKQLQGNTMDALTTRINVYCPDLGL